MGMNALVFNVLKEIGINPERFSLQWASAAEAPRFVKLITDFTGKMKELGPLGESEGIAPDELQAKLEKGLAAVSSRKVRMVYSNTAKAIRKEGIFTQEYISGVMEEKLSKAITGALSADEAEAEPMAEPAKPVTAAKTPKKEETTPIKKAADKAKVSAKKPAKKTAAPKKAVVKKATATKKKAAAKKKTAPQKKK